MNDLILQRLKKYHTQDTNEVINAYKEIAQEIILYGLSKTSFFDEAFFCGGTSLRIVYGMNRFSEDLDFSTLNQDTDFSFDRYLESVLKTLQYFGLEMKVTRAKDDSFVHARALKEDSEKWKISLPSPRKEVMIKLEIDTKPPLSAKTEFKNLDYPLLHRIRCGSLDTLFAGKIHALLCRPFTKGRDWYDFLFYMQNNTTLNFEYLKNALFQMGPYQGLKLEINSKFVKNELQEKTKNTDWQAAKKEMSRFLKAEEQPSLHLWDEHLFLSKIDQL